MDGTVVHAQPTLVLRRETNWQGRWPTKALLNRVRGVGGGDEAAERASVKSGATGTAAARPTHSFFFWKHTRTITQTHVDTHTHIPSDRAAPVHRPPTF